MPKAKIAKTTKTVNPTKKLQTEITQLKNQLKKALQENKNLKDKIVKIGKEKTIALRQEFTKGYQKAKQECAKQKAKKTCCSKKPAGKTTGTVKKVSAKKRK